MRKLGKFYNNNDFKKILEPNQVLNVVIGLPVSPLDKTGYAKLTAT